MTAPADLVNRNQGAAEMTISMRTGFTGCIAAAVMLGFAPTSGFAQTAAVQLPPRHPIELAGRLHAPVLGLYGGADQGIPVDTVEKMRNTARAAGKKVEMIVYPEAGHAFHADYRPSYKKEAAEDGWKKAIAWFKQHGVA